ncbi:MAG: crossover junction endodeoxyribonuclease RuvC [Actinomycetota bacterium]
MFERVLGVDPGVAATGLAVLERNVDSSARVVWADTVRTSSSAAEADRLLALHRAAGGALETYSPESVAVERLLWGRNVGSAMTVARASGVVLLAAGQSGVPVYEYAPLEVKMAVTGSGSAAKEQVRHALERLHRIADLPDQSDAVDAVAVALCHLNRARVEAGA